MRPTELYTGTRSSALDTVVPLAVDYGTIDTIQSATALERAIGSAVLILFVSIVALGFVQGYGNRAVTTCRKSPIITICIGLPSVLVVSLLTWVGILIADISIGVFFSVLLISFGAAVLPTAVVIGFVSIGQSIAGRVGADQLWVGVLVGSLLGGLAAISIPVGIAAATIAACFGMGAGVRLVLGRAGTSSPEERSVPPANRT